MRAFLQTNLDVINLFPEQEILQRLFDAFGFCLCQEND